MAGGVLWLIRKAIVDIVASQARRRLKRFGHGVRKVQTGGKNQAVIIHTATGRHLEELKNQFADVGYSSVGDEPVDDGHTPD